MKMKDVDFEGVPDEFMDYEVVYHSEWYTYEEYGVIVVFKVDDQLFSVEDGYCVFDYCESSTFTPDPITPYQLEDIISEWDDINEKV